MRRAAFPAFPGFTRFSGLFLPLILSLGCAHKPDLKTEAPAPRASAAPVTAASADRQCTQDADCQDAEVCDQSKCVAISAANVGDCSLIRVHFPFDSVDILPADRPELERSARCLRGHQHISVTIEGNADERGTEEYNLALGDRRANAVAKYLKGLGASEAQLKTVSYGKARPECTEHDEACWSKNRRAAIRPPAVASKE